MAGGMLDSQGTDGVLRVGGDNSSLGEWVGGWVNTVIVLRIYQAQYQSKGVGSVQVI
jgi:hypothetical protein